MSTVLITGGSRGIGAAAVAAFARRGGLKQSQIEELQRMIDSANASVIPSRWGPDWRTAAGLFTAHLAALCLQTYADGSTPAATAGNSANVGTVKTATLGDTSLSYDNAATNAGTEKWGAWNLTRYGSQLATMARMIGIAGMYAI